ncbi:MAG: glucuronyl esterase domain-containing protein [Promethearchaeota archaeon]
MFVLEIPPESCIDEWFEPCGIHGGFRASGSLNDNHSFKESFKRPFTNLPVVRPYYQIKKFPDPFLMKDGTRVVNKDDWQARRKEILEQMLEIQYGTQAPVPEEVTCTLLSEEVMAGGEIFQKYRLVMIPCKKYPDIEFSLSFTLIIPPPDAIENRREEIQGWASDGKFPVHFFVGGDACYDVVLRGYLHVIYEKGGQEGIQNDFGKGNPEVPIGSCKDAYMALNEMEPGKWDFSWGYVSIWAWGTSRVLDYLFTRDDVDKEHVIISGHSVNGKIALCAAAMDERFTMVNPSGSGCGGAAAYLFLDGLMPDGAFEQQTEPPENLKALTSHHRWYHWMAPKLHEFTDREEVLPFDQHFIMATIAPRLLFMTEGDVDWWANPLGVTSLYFPTNAVFEWLGCKDNHGMVWHKGGHFHSFGDREAVLDFSEWHWFGVKSDRDFHVPHPDKKVLAALPKLFDWSAPN